MVHDHSFCRGARLLKQQSKSINDVTVVVLVYRNGCGGGARAGGAWRTRWNDG